MDSTVYEIAASRRFIRSRLPARRCLSARRKPLSKTLPARWPMTCPTRLTPARRSPDSLL